MSVVRKVVATLGILILLAPVALANSTSLAQAESSQFDLRQKFLGFFNRETEDRTRGGPGISRGPDVPVDDDFCVVSPGRHEVIWHQHPLFIMQGQINHMQVRETWQDLTQPTPLALGIDAAVPNAEGFVVTRFGNLTLQPATEYEWLFYGTPDDDILYLLPFSVMAAGEERDQIATDLAQLETELAQEGASTEAIAQAQADYFLTKDMPADALQILFSVEGPSADLVALRAETIETICSFRLGRETPLVNK